MRIWAVFLIGFGLCFAVGISLSADRESASPATMRKANSVSNDSRPQVSQDISISDEEDFEDLAELDFLVDESSGFDVLGATETEERQFAEVTAHMSDDQLVEYMALRGRPIVRSVAGVLDASYSKMVNCSDWGLGGECIVHLESKEVIFSGDWADGFAPTGVGLEVVRVK